MAMTYTLLGLARVVLLQGDAGTTDSDRRKSSHRSVRYWEASHRAWRGWLKYARRNNSYGQFTLVLLSIAKPFVSLENTPERCECSSGKLGSIQKSVVTRAELTPEQAIAARVTHQPGISGRFTSRHPQHPQRDRSYRWADTREMDVLRLLARRDFRRRNRTTT
jgi:hypothetical protein